METIHVGDHSIAFDAGTFFVPAIDNGEPGRPVQRIGLTRDGSDWKIGGNAVSIIPFGDGLTVRIRGTAPDAHDFEIENPIWAALQDFADRVLG